MKPGVVRFVPSGTESVTYTFVANTGPFEADDDHRFDLQWQSPTGTTITLHAGAVNLSSRRASRAARRQTRSGPALGPARFPLDPSR